MRVTRSNNRVYLLTDVEVVYVRRRRRPDLAIHLLVFVKLFFGTLELIFELRNTRFSRKYVYVNSKNSYQQLTIS